MDITNASGTSTNVSGIVSAPPLHMPHPTILNLPSRPTIAPMPPPPIGIIQTRTFQPIHPNFYPESPTGSMVTLVTPKPVHMPTPNQGPSASMNPTLSTYFGTPASLSGLTSSFQSTPITSTPFQPGAPPPITTPPTAAPKDETLTGASAREEPLQPNPNCQMHDV